MGGRGRDRVERELSLSSIITDPFEKAKSWNVFQISILQALEEIHHRIEHVNLFWESMNLQKTFVLLLCRPLDPNSDIINKNTVHINPYIVFIYKSFSKYSFLLKMPFTFPPCIYLFMLSMASSMAVSMASGTIPELWGVPITFGRSRKG